MSDEWAIWYWLTDMESERPKVTPQHLANNPVRSVELLRDSAYELIVSTDRFVLYRWQGLLRAYIHKDLLK